MRSISLVLVAWLFCFPLEAATPYRLQMQRLRNELEIIKDEVKKHLTAEAILLSKHRQTVRVLRALEEQLRRKEGRIHSLQDELFHYEHALRQAVLETDKFQLQNNVERLRELMAEARTEMRVDESEIMRKRSVAIEIASEIQRERIELSSLSLRAKASDLQISHLNRKLKGL